ncbi:uncharacterized protein LOC133805517 [Humulus lupulus]|uniref:uncharacterized protein LOC133805517 n=1 Tax=Humulus lupulus TaxID=3486 RepID=UPI002B403D1D|nr:uncharacterized protein LOC133805517 [Humulus lupulus]
MDCSVIRKKPVQQKTWVVKQNLEKESKVASACVLDEDGFQQVQRGGKIRVQPLPATVIEHNFQVLMEQGGEVEDVIENGVRSNNGHEGFLVTFVYAFNDENGRDIFWRDLKFLARGHKQPWVVLGDFNDILNAYEMVGNRVQRGSSSAFKDCIEECQLEDVKYSGCFFTWNNKQDKEGRIYSKIDRVMENQEWLTQHELAEVLFLPEVYQDLKRKQECLNKDPLNEQLIEQETAARREYIAVHKSLLSFLYQKSKLAWIKEGDENTHIFHSSIRARRIRNIIYSIQDMAGNWVENPGAVITAFLNYYQELLGTKLEDRRRVQIDIVECGTVLSEEKARFLLSDYTNDEVKRTIFGIPSIKAPGPDGYASCFFHDN